MNKKDLNKLKLIIGEEANFLGVQDLDSYTDAQLIKDAEYLVKELNGLYSDLRKAQRDVARLKTMVNELRVKEHFLNHILDNTLVNKTEDTIEGTSYVDLYELELAGRVSVEACVYDSLERDE